MPVLLYGCETWMLDATCIQALEKFQCEIGRRILKLSKHHPSDPVRIALNWPTISTRILLRKPTFLSRLITNSDDTTQIFTSLAIVDVYSITIVQQCRLLVYRSLHFEDVVIHLLVHGFLSKHLLHRMHHTLSPDIGNVALDGLANGRPAACGARRRGFKSHLRYVVHFSLKKDRWAVSGVVML